MPQHNFFICYHLCTKNALQIRHRIRLPSYRAVDSYRLPATLISHLFALRLFYGRVALTFRYAHWFGLRGA